MHPLTVMLMIIAFVLTAVGALHHGDPELDLPVDQLDQIPELDQPSSIASGTAPTGVVVTPMCTTNKMLGKMFGSGWARYHRGNFEVKVLNTREYDDLETSRMGTLLGGGDTTELVQNDPPPPLGLKGRSKHSGWSSDTTSPDLHSLPLTNLIGLMRSEIDEFGGISGKLKGHKWTIAKQMFLYRAATDSELEVVPHSGFAIFYETQLYVSGIESEEEYVNAPNPEPDATEPPSTYVILTIMKKPMNVTIENVDPALSEQILSPLSSQAGELSHCGGTPANNEFKVQWKIYRSYSPTLPVKWEVEEMYLSPPCECSLNID